MELDGTRIKWLLWVQYEGNHASNTSTYNYRDETVAHSGRTWHRLLRAKGWRMGPEITSERLVWLLDAPARNELMIIYMEDGADQGSEAFHRRAVAAFTVRAR